jgi:hypothetical protein
MVLDSIHTSSSCYYIFGSWLSLMVMPFILSYRDSLSSPINKVKNKYWHRIGFITRATAAVLLCPLPYLSVYAFYFWIIFDGTYNLFTGKPWFYVGITAKTDKVTSKYNHWIKWIGLICSTIATLVFIL